MTASTPITVHIDSIGCCIWNPLIQGMKKVFQWNSQLSFCHLCSFYWMHFSGPHCHCGLSVTQRGSWSKPEAGTLCGCLSCRDCQRPCENEGCAPGHGLTPREGLGHQRNTPQCLFQLTTHWSAPIISWGASNRNSQVYHFCVKLRSQVYDTPEICS